MSSRDRSFLRLLLVVVTAGAVIVRAPTTAAEVPLEITSVAANHSSVTIEFEAIEGARDYRAYDIAHPDDVKYAGLTGESSPVPVPATTIEWNSVGDGQPHTLIVEAVDRLGPVPFESLYDSATNAPLFNTRSAGAMLGSNKGPSLDGKTSTNGQGPYTNGPRVLARSRPFVVSADPGYRPIPSTSVASSTFLDTFDNAEGRTIDITAMDANAGTMRFTMNAGTPRAATIQYQKADVTDSMPFVAADHFMDMLFDGGTPGTNVPLHQGRAVMALSPDATALWQAGQVLHVTQEVDGHVNSRRWMELVVVPASDPVLGFDPNSERLNAENAGAILRLEADDQCSLDLYPGMREGAIAAPGARRLWGAAGQAPAPCNGLGANDLGFDRRARYDLFLSQARAALFVNGRLVQQSRAQAGSLPWANRPVKIYYTHYVYHTDNDIAELRTYRCTPLNAFWFNDPIHGIPASPNSCASEVARGFGFPRSDERHWDNLGFEVLPSGIAQADDYSSLARLVQPPRTAPPTY